MKQVTKKFHFKKHCNFCKKHGGAHTTHATKECCKYEKDQSLKDKFHSSKKAAKKPNPAKQSFVQLTKKLDKLEKTLKIASPKSKKWHRDDSDYNSE